MTYHVTSRQTLPLASRKAGGGGGSGTLENMIFKSFSRDAEQSKKTEKNAFFFHFLAEARGGRQHCARENERFLRFFVIDFLNILMKNDEFLLFLVILINLSKESLS